MLSAKQFRRQFSFLCSQEKEPDGDVKLSPQNLTLKLRPGTSPHLFELLIVIGCGLTC